MAEGRGGSSTSNVRNLTDAMRKVRIAEADRSDGFVDLQEAERARLEMLADELRDVFAEFRPRTTSSSVQRLRPARSRVCGST